MYLFGVTVMVILGIFMYLSSHKSRATKEVFKIIEGSPYMNEIEIATSLIYLDNVDNLVDERFISSAVAFLGARVELLAELKKEGK